MRQACVVVIENEVDILDMVCDLLDTAGYQVIAVTHPDQLQDALHDVQPDLFLMNVMLPGQTGMDLARRLRKDGYPDTPMISMSASTTMMALARRSGVFQDEIDKPFDMDVLLRTVHHLIPPCA